MGSFISQADSNFLHIWRWPLTSNVCTFVSRVLVLRVWATTQFYAVLGINTRTSCMRGKYSTNWATSTATNANFWTHIMNFSPPMIFDLIWCYVIYCVLEARSICMCRHQRTTAGSQFSPATWLTQGSSHFWCCVVHSWLVVLWPSRQSFCLWHSSHYRRAESASAWTAVITTNFLQKSGDQIQFISLVSKWSYSQSHLLILIVLF